MCLLLTIPLQAQQLFYHQYPAETYKGATQNWEMDQDADGVLYFANNDGVLTYDGKDWNLLSMPNKEFVYSIALDETGNIFVSSFNELGFFLKDHTGKFRYHSLLNVLPEQFRDFKYMNQIIAHDDKVFFVDQNRIYKYEDSTFGIIDIPNSRLLKHKTDLYLVNKEGLLKYEDPAFVRTDLNEALRGKTIRWISSYADDSFMVLDDKNFLWTLSTTTKRLELISNEFGKYLEGLSRFRMLSLDNGNLAILSMNDLLILDPQLQPVYTITKEALGENFTNRVMYEDRQHNLWFATSASLIHVITSSPLGYFDKNNGLNGVMLSLGKKNQHHYVGTNTGIFYKETNGSFTELPVKRGEAWNFYDYEDKLLVAHSSGVLQLNGANVEQLIEHRYVHALCSIKGKADHLIMGTYNSGIWLLSREKTGWIKTKIKGFEEETRFIQQDDDQNFWVSHYNKGLFRLKLNEAFDSVVSQRFYSKDDGLPSNLNNRIYRLSKGNMIVTTAEGIYKHDPASDRFVPMHEINKYFPEPVCIYTIAENDLGDLYFWAGMGGKKECAGTLIRRGDGYQLVSKPFLKTAVQVRDLRVDVDAPMLCTDSHKLWIGNNLKLIQYDASQKTFFDEPVSTIIKQVWARDSSILHITNQVSYSNNNIRVTYACPFFESSPITEYQYKLDGFQNQWSVWRQGNEATFTNLPQGNYTFAVRARNLYGNVSEPAIFSFYVHPPWFKTWWAYAMYAILSLAVIGIMIRVNTSWIRIKKLKLEKKVRKKTKKLRARNKEIREKSREIAKQAKELEKLNLTKDKLFSIVSHDLRGPIKQIQVVMNLMDLNHITEDEFKAFFPRFKESIEHTVNLTDNLLHWANSQMEGLQAKPSRINLREIAEENFRLFKPLADGKKISFVNQISADVFGFADKDMIKLVLRNLVNNAIKFTNEGQEVTLGTEKNGKTITVFVRDTGIGITEEAKSMILRRNNLSTQGTFGEKGVGLGLMLCHEFIEKNGGVIGVESEPGKGSTFSFSLPIAVPD